jgi:hypothetical protein
VYILYYDLRGTYFYKRPLPLSLQKFQLPTFCCIPYISNMIYGKPKRKDEKNHMNFSNTSNTGSQPFN